MRYRWPGFTFVPGKPLTGGSFPTPILINSALKIERQVMISRQLNLLSRRRLSLSKKGAILGFATTAPSRGADLPGYGELCALHVDPQQLGRGIGLALMRASRARLRDLGFQNAVLWVVSGNVRAERFYMTDRWAADGVQRTGKVPARHDDRRVPLPTTTHSIMVRLNRAGHQRRQRRGTICMNVGSDLSSGPAPGVGRLAALK